MPDYKEIISVLDPSTPILMIDPKPTFRTTEEKAIWWGKENEKFEYGITNHYGLFIPGSLYFFARLGTVVNRRSGAEVKKIIRDVDYLIHKVMYDDRAASKWSLWLKSRNCGFTTQAGGVIPIYFAYMYSGCTVNLTSADNERIGNMFRKCLMPMYDGMDVEVRPDKKTSKDSDVGVGLTLLVNTIENGKPKTKDTYIRCKATAHSDSAASSFSGGGSMYNNIDEKYLNARGERVAQSLLDVSRDKDTGKLEGYTISGGTAEAVISQEQLTIYKREWTKADNSHIWSKTFIPFYLGSFMTNGHSNFEKATENWEKEAEGYLKAGDNEGYIAFRKNHPRDESDVFEFATSSKWDADVSQSIKMQYDSALKQKSEGTNTWIPHVVGKLKDKVEVIPTNKSGVEIYEHPKANIRYLACCDGTGTGTESGNTEGSNFAVTIIKMYDPQGESYGVVATYNERPKNLEEAFYKLLYLSLYYNTYNGLVTIAYEANASVDYFSTWMTKQGYLNLVMLRKDLSGKGYSKENRYGQPRTKEVIEYQYRFANQHLRKYISSIKCIPLLENMLQDFEENTDLLDAWLMGFIALPPDYDQIIEKKKPKREIKFIQNPDGSTRFQVVEQGARPQIEFPSQFPIPQAV